MHVDYHKNFKKKYKKFSKKQQDKINNRIALFVEDEFNEILNNHKLHGEYLGCRSIDITGDIRAIYKTDKRNVVVFIEIGSHSDLY